MPRHPPIALKTLDHSHCQCPSGSLRTVLAEKTSFSRLVRWPAVKPPIILEGIERSPPTHHQAMGPNKSSLHNVIQNRQPANRLQNLFFFIRMMHTPNHIPLDIQQTSRRWWSWTGSNRRPPACKAGALPAELQPLNAISPKPHHQAEHSERNVVGLDRLELSTSPLSGVRSNHLSYRP